MKRFTTRVLILALVGLLAAGGVAFGSETDPAIGMTYKDTIDLTKALTETSSYTADFPNLSLTWSGAIDDNHTFEAKLSIADTESGAGAVTGQGHFVVDLIGALGIDAPVGASLVMGNKELSDFGHGKVTSHGYENVAEHKINGGTLGLLITADGGISIGLDTIHNFSKTLVKLGVVADPISLGGFLSVDSSDIGFGAEAALDEFVGLPLDLGVEVEIDGGDSTLDYGVGVAVDLTAAALGVSVSTSGGTLTYVGADVNLPLDIVTVKADVKYDIATTDTAKALNGLGIDLDFGAFDAGIDLRSAGADVQNAYFSYAVSL
jgi:hypothetical protein